MPVATSGQSPEALSEPAGETPCRVDFPHPMYGKSLLAIFRTQSSKQGKFCVLFHHFISPFCIRNGRRMRIYVNEFCCNLKISPQEVGSENGRKPPQSKKHFMISFIGTKICEFNSVRKKSPQLVGSENSKNTTLSDKINRMFSFICCSLFTFRRMDEISL